MAFEIVFVSLPLRRHVADLIRVHFGQVLCLAAVGLYVVEFPGAVASIGYEFPVANSNGAVALVVEIDEVVFDLVVFHECGHQGRARKGLGGFSVPLARKIIASRHVEDGRNDVDEVAWVVTQFAAGCDAGRPMDDQRRGCAALVDP